MGLNPSGSGEATPNPLLTVGLVVTELPPLKLVSGSTFVKIELSSHRLLLDNLLSILELTESTVRHTKGLFPALDDAEKGFVTGELAKLGFILGELLAQLEVTDLVSVFNRYSYLTLANVSEASVDLVNHWYRLLNVSSSVSRTRRGLFDIGGEILHGLFGLAVDRDVQELREVTNSLLMEAKTLYANELKLSKIVSRSLDAIANLSMDLAKQQNDITTLEKFSILSDVLEDLIVTGTHLISVSENLKLETRLLDLNILVNLIDRESLKEFIASGIKDNIGVFPLSNAQIDDHEDVALQLLSVTKTKTPYTYLVRVPFVQNDKIFDLVSLQRLPVKTSVGNVTSFKWLSRVPRFVAFNTASFLELEDVSKCHRTSVLYLCEPSIAATQTVFEPSCILTLLQTHQHSAKCEYEPVESSLQEYGVFTTNEWHVAFLQPTLVKIRCNSSSPSVRSTQIVSGIVSIYAPCFLLGSKGTYRTKVVTSMRADSNRVKIFPLSSMPSVKVSQTQLTRHLVSELESNMEDVRQLNVALEAHKQHTLVWFPHFHAIHGSITVILLLGIIASIVLYCH
ncbi:uncharacterized protein LOC125178449 [Hyalella azteca]|uniref:Uncharacterized protein LOC125178449 n=1 Tax=Hyalella azteca TaxID=294128 RepID=A0A979FPM6_HYAAZ|nr:uncharacterized protein LOC125178449 [Hyalella azteca]